MWSPGFERELRSGTAAPGVSRPRRLAKPRRKPTRLHAHLCLSSKDSRRSPRDSRASLPASPGLVQVAVAAPSGSATVAPQPPRPSAVVARGRTAPGGNFPGTGIRLGPRRRQWRGLRAGRPPDQRSRPRGPDESPSAEGPLELGGEGDTRATDLTRGPGFTGRAPPSARAFPPLQAGSPRSPGRACAAARTRSRVWRLPQSSRAERRCGHRPCERGSRAPCCCWLRCWPPAEGYP